MSRTLGGPLTSHIAQRAHTRCRMVLLDLADGTRIGVTDHNRDLTFNLGDGEVVYSCRTGLNLSDITLKVGFEVDNTQLDGPIGSVVTEAAVLGGRFNRARVRVFQVNWASLGSGAIKFLAGNIGEAVVLGNRYQFQVRSDIDYLNQTIGSVIGPNCRNDFGDARCQFPVVDVPAIVTAVDDSMRFTVSTDDPFADDYFNLGTVQFTTGALEGGRPVEIFDWADTGDLETFLRLAAEPEVGDELILRRGCPKNRPACRELYDNVLNFNGFPEVPGSDQVLRPQIPKS